ncbi:MAG: CHAD domain-containing protein [Acidimicrobiia bacterium]
MHLIPLPAAEERRFLPAISDGFAIGRREPLAVGLRRVTVDQFDVALASMAQDPMDLAVHEVRKATKRVRALLRLVRNQLGDERYRTENAVLRDTARLLAPLRDADVHVSSVEGLRNRFGAQLRSTAFADLAGRLADRRHRVFERTVDEDDWSRVLYSLRSARARYAAWPVDDDTARAHGMAVVRHGFSSVGPGLALTYRRGRQEMSEAATRPTADNFHAWRKRAKYLRHQLELLGPIFPEVLDGYAAALGRLGEVLGDEHDLAELLRFIAAHPSYVSDPTERSMLVALVQHRRAELQTAALSLGSRVYAETPNRFTGRVGDYWSAWDAPVPVGYTDQP